MASTAQQLLANFGYIDAAYVGTLVHYMQLRCKRHYKAALPWKMAASILFLLKAVTYVAGPPEYSTTYRWLVFAGLSLGTFGDYFLDQKYSETSKDSNDRYTMWGFRLFFVAHLMNAGAVLSLSSVQKQSSMGLGAAVVGISVAAAAGVVLTEKLFGLTFGRFKLVTFIYSIAIAAATLIAQIASSKSSETAEEYVALNYLRIGLWLFVASDLLLSHTYFGKDKNTSPYVIGNTILYYGAQWFIASSVAAISD